MISINPDIYAKSVCTDWFGFYSLTLTKIKKITIKSVVEFRRKDEKRRLAFLNGLLPEKESKEDDKGGGDYGSVAWVPYQMSFTIWKKRIDGKIAELEDWIEETEHKGTKVRWQRNIDILHNFEDFDFESLRPDDIHLLKTNGASKRILIK